MVKAPFKNGLLARFDSEVLRRLDLRRIELPADREIEFPGNHIDNLFFIEQGMASMTTTFEDGVQVWTALAGSEGVLGASVLMGTKRSLNRVYMQVAGFGYATDTALAVIKFERCDLFRNLTARYLQAQLFKLRKQQHATPTIPSSSV